MTSLLRATLARLRRTRRGLLAIALWSFVAVVGALIARAGDANGADRALRGTFGVVVAPLLSYGIVSAALGGRGLRTSIRGFVALGSAPSRAALATVLTAMALSAVACGFVAGLVCVVAHGPSDPPLVRDLPASFCVGFLGGLAYAAYFGAGSAIGSGAMRGVFLALDFLLGASAGFGALFTPRAHVTSLLGGRPCFDLSPRASSVLLLLLAVVYLALATRLARRAAR